MKNNLDTKEGQYRAGYLSGRLFWSGSAYRRRCATVIDNLATIHQLYSNETPPEGFLIASNPKKLKNALEKSFRLGRKAGVEYEN